jgi:hypothetical protein
MIYDSSKGKEMTKSPVYGGGRNRKHRAKRSSPFHPAAANVNMRGKKEKLASCMCCSCIDFREKIQREEHRKEINDYTRSK